MSKNYSGINSTGFLYFYKYLGYRVLILLSLGVSVAVLDGFGLALFIPMLQLVKDGSFIPAEGLGKLNFLLTFFSKTGLQYNLQNVMLLIIILFMAKGMINFLHQLYIVKLQVLLLKKLRLDAVEGLGKFKYTHFVHANPGRIQSTLSEDIHLIADSFHGYFLCMSTALMISAYLIISLAINFQFSIFLIIGSLLTSLIFRYFHKKTKASSVKFTESSHDFQSLLLQQVNHFKYLKATNLMSLYTQKIRNRILITEDITKKMGFNSSLVIAIREPVAIILILVILYFQLTIFQQSFATLFLSLILFYRSLSLIMQLQNAWHKYLLKHGSIKNYKEFMLELNAGEETHGHLAFGKLEEKIELKNVSFTYGEKQVIDGINMVIPKNKTIALVGKSGSGKTTLVNLIAGLIPVDSGDILFDNVNIREIDINTFRNRVGYITQDPVIFNDTVYNNITSWAERSEPNLEQYRKVMEQACLHTFSNQEDAMLGSNGINVSGGEKQRIAIARELFKNIDILVIDEGTSSLDTETEMVIRESIDSLRGKLTIFIIAHRLSTIKNADTIILLRNGKIEDKGHYDELKENSILFQKMIDLQML